MTSPTAPLKLPGFRHLGFAYTVNELGNWLGEIALAVLVFDQTGSPIATAALFLGMQFLPALVSQGLVARLEIRGVRAMLPILYAAEGAVFVALGLLANNFVLAVVVALAALDGSLAIASRAFTRTTAAAVLKPAGLLRQGNALLNIGFTGAGAIGPALAGVVVATMGVQTALFMDAGSFLLVALTLAAARSLPETRGEPHPWLGRIREAIGYVRERRILGRLIAANAVVLVFLTAVVPIEIVYAKESLHAGNSGYGALLAAWGIGMVLGSFAFAAARRSPLRILIFVSAVAVGVSYLGMSVAATLLIACLAAAFGGAGNGVLWVSLVSAVQELTASDFQARVIGLLEASSSAAPGIGFVLGGLIAYLFSPRVSFFVAGAGALLVVLLAAPGLKRANWTPQDAHDIGAADQFSVVDAAQIPTIP